MASIITVLKKVYKEGLEPLGFVQLKGRQPYFVRIIGGEIIQVISFRKEPGHERKKGWYNGAKKREMTREEKRWTARM